MWQRRARILEKETQHFLRCVRPLRIRIGAGRAASGPGVAGTVDIPVLQDLTLAVGVGRAGIAMAAGYLPAMHLLLRPDRPDSLFDSLSAVVGMHGGAPRTAWRPAPPAMRQGGRNGSRPQRSL